MFSFRISTVTYKENNIIENYLLQQDKIFTSDDFYKFLKSEGVRMSMSDAIDILHMSDYVFPLVNDEYITRAGIFTGYVFSFKPSKEEVNKGVFLLGHRCMPFINPETAPDSISVMAHGAIIKSSSAKISMNLAMDTFSLYGEGYAIPYIFNDKKNKLSLSSVRYSMPTEMRLTVWPLDKITEDEKFCYGDRVLCRVINWEESLVEMMRQPGQTDSLIVSNDAIEREQWYSDFENSLLASFDKLGPMNSIEEQLAYIFLENKIKLCTKNPGSVEEFLEHTTKIGFEPYGVESRIWKKGESVPYIGEWNKESIKSDFIMSQIAMTFTPRVIDAYIENLIYDNIKNKKDDSEHDFSDLVDLIFPSVFIMTQAERRLVLLNIEKRHDILKRNYNQFSDYPVAEIRKRILKLFSQVNELLGAIGHPSVKIENFPQQELAILSQLYSHVVHLLEEVENVFLRNHFPVDEVSLSLDGMEETFEDICVPLSCVLESDRKNGFEIVKNDSIELEDKK